MGRDDSDAAETAQPYVVGKPKTGYAFERGRKMIPLVSEAIQNYADAHSSPEPELFQELAKETRATQKDPQMMVGHSEGLLLRVLVMLSRARRVLEIGTFTGYSALAMAMALPAEGELITCDVDSKSTTLAQKYWAKSPHGKKIRLELAPASDTIAMLQGHRFCFH